jgi:hypothetical protein
MIFPAKFNVTSLNGKNGFAFTNNLSGSLFGHIFGRLGDINKDGKSDLILTITNLHQACVLFGASSFPKKLYSESLNGKNGFLIIAEDPYTPSCSITGIGDINGDSIDDFIVGQCSMDKAYVIFGAKSFPPRLSLANIGVKDGFQVVGANFTSASGIGDFNGDGKQDFIIGSAYSNSVFCIYGTSEFPAVVDVTRVNGNNGFRIVGPLFGYFGGAIAGIGDFNGDSKPDIVMGVWRLDVQAIVVFGANNFPAVFGTSDLNGKNGFIINGPNSFANSQQEIAGIGDVNGDSLADLGIGCWGLTNSLCGTSGETFLVFGARHFNVTFNVSSLNGENGVKLIGPQAGPQGSAFGAGLSELGSINNNGKASVIVGAMQTGANAATGSAYVFFGSNHFLPEIHASSLNGTNGFEIVGSTDAGLGSYVGGIDNLLGDGKPSIVVGALLEDTVYVILDASNL